jgi:hypothetical protein
MKTTGSPSSISLGMLRAPMFAAKATSFIVPSRGPLLGVTGTEIFFRIFAFLVVPAAPKRERAQEGLNSSFPSCALAHH